MFSADKNVSVDILINAPFYRSCKYHLLLNDYCSKLDRSHPDYLHMQKAIKSYLKITDQNNVAMMKK